MSDQVVYKVTVSGPGLSLDREVPTSIGEQVVVLILGGHTPPPPGTGSGAHAGAKPAGATPGTQHSGVPLSLREFLQDCQAKRAPDKITAIAYYLKQHRGQSSFRRADLEGLFQEAAEPAPKNVPRDLKWAVRVGWVAPRTDDTESYYVTNRGTEAVHAKFPPDVIKKTGLESGRGKKGNGSKAAKE